MSVFHFPLSILHLLGLAAVSLICGLLVWPQLSAAWPSIEEKIDLFRRQPPLAKLVLLLFVGAFVVFGSTKTNGVGNSQGGSGVLAACQEGEIPCSNRLDSASSLAGRLEVAHGAVSLTSGEDAASPLTVTDTDIARGWQLWEVRTNSNVCYTMPEGATLASNWWVRGAFEDCSIVRLGDCSIGGCVSQSNNLNNPNNQTMSFPFGTNEYDSVWAFSWGKLRFVLGDAETEIAAVGAPMSAVPYRSRLWSAADTNDSRFVTWENFVLGRALKEDVDSLTSGETPLPLCCAQVELRSTGDFIVRSNEVETVYRRVDPEDWDGDGWRNDDDYNPYSRDDCNDDFYQELPYDADTNAYCWIEVRPEWNTWIDFQGDSWSNLSDPYFTARAGRTYRVWLLIGKTYSVFAPMPVCVVGRSDDRIEITDVTENSFTVVWPVMFTVAEGRAPTGRPRLGATWNDGGKSFYVLPDPDWLRGDIVWYGACCNVWGDGTNFTYACNGDCTCTGCRVYGDYLYEGYGLTVNGIPCGCHYVPDHGPFEVMQFSFDKSAAIYEDDYTNMPGVVIHPTPSNVVLRCEVYGGTYGGRLTIALNAAGRSKIARFGGNLLPSNVEIPPDTTRVFETEYTPLEPSGTTNDIVATATYVENFRNESHTATATLTSIRLQLAAIYDAPENHNPSRHVYGVGEKVRFLHEPEAAELGYHAVKWDVNDNLGYYDQFNGNIDEADKHRIYVCPISSNYRPRVSVSYNGAAYAPSISVIEPEEIICRHVSWKRDLFQPGEVGPITLVTTNQIGPLTVSFCGIKVGEIPCSEVIQPTGYFNTSNFVGELTHYSTAGYAARIKNEHGGNYWCSDEAGRKTPYENWSAGVLAWKIPIGWLRLLSDSDLIGNPSAPEYERCGDASSRPLLIGGTTGAYLQIFTINEMGFVTVEKFGHTASRSMLGDVYIDGRAVTWPQQ